MSDAFDFEPTDYLSYHIQALYEVIKYLKTHPDAKAVDSVSNVEGLIQYLEDEIENYEAAHKDRMM